MVEGGEEGFESSSRSKTASSFESAGGRLRFRVELRPGETTIVSWKKLLKEATSSKPNGLDPSVVGPCSETPQAVPQPLIPMAASSKLPVAEKEAKDSQAQAGSNRLNNVIERIERMYAGNGSSDEEDVVLDDVPDDDEYDTEDSFIDDTELDDYFQVDNSAIKHDGFFVNRGKLERIEPTISADQQPKKRRRKDLTKGLSGSDDGHNPNKHVKIGEKGRKSASSIERKSISKANRVTLPNIDGEDMEFQDFPMNVPEIPLMRKTSGSKSIVNASGLLNGDIVGQDRDVNLQRTGVLSSNNHNNKQKDDGELQVTAIRMPSGRSLYEHKSRSGNNADEANQSIKQKQKSGHVERLDLNVPASRDTLHAAKVSLMQRKEGSAVRPKSTMLDKAIRDLEKIVAESRPPSTEIQDPDNSSQAVKRRLPQEIKQKLAKVARLTQVSYGKIPKDVINRLMSIVGHLMQLRTLKRNLKVMANMGLSVKQEKDNQVQRMKQELADMVKLRILYMKSKIDQQTASSDDFQGAGPGDGESLKRKYSIDDALGNKICDLYDLYVERLEEDSGPPLRKLYEELAALWPSGVMDTDVIKRAIHRAKGRRRAVPGRQKDQEKIKKVLTTKTDDAIRGETTVVSQASHLHEKLPLDPCEHSSTSMSKPNLGGAVALPAAPVPVALANDPHTDKPKQEKMKGNFSKNQTDATSMDVVLKKKVKRKPGTEEVEAQLHLEKVAPEAEERHKYHKPRAASLPKSDVATPSNVEQPN